MKKNSIRFTLISMLLISVLLCGLMVGAHANENNSKQVIKDEENNESIIETKEALIEKGYTDSEIEFEELFQKIETMKANDISDEEILELLDIQAKNNLTQKRGNPLGIVNKYLKMWDSLTNDEKKLIIAYPNKALVALAATNKASDYTKKEYGRSTLGDESDAFRHTLWCALMSRDIDAKYALDFSTAHESGKSEEFLQQVADDGFKEIEHMTMDLHNNSIGVKLGDGFNGTDETLIAKIKENMTNDLTTGVYWLHD